MTKQILRNSLDGRLLQWGGLALALFLFGAFAFAPAAPSLAEARATRSWASPSGGAATFDHHDGTRSFARRGMRPGHVSRG